MLKKRIPMKKRGGYVQKVAGVTAPRGTILKVKAKSAFVAPSYRGSFSVSKSK